MAGCVSRRPRIIHIFSPRRLCTKIDLRRKCTSRITPAWRVERENKRSVRAILGFQVIDFHAELMDQPMDQSWKYDFAIIACWGVPQLALKDASTTIIPFCMLIDIGTLESCRGCQPRLELSALSLMPFLFESLRKS